MLENKLTFTELSRLLSPFLRLDSPSEIIAALQDTLHFTVKCRDDIVGQKKIQLTYEGYRVDIRDIELFEDNFSILVQFKASQKWWHNMFRDQNAKIIRDLQNICAAEIAHLQFARFEKKIYQFQLSGENHFTIVLLHDSRALNLNWKEGYDLSPLTIAPDCHDGNCFVEFLFNPMCYKRSAETTVLRDDWRSGVFCISDSINQKARQLLGEE